LRFHGLFVGIDRYESPQINWLACARRDAIALHALFGDTLGGTSTILLDEKATKRNITESFTAFSECDEEDVVVMAFSGHGSETHELVTYDANVSNLPESGIPLQTLTDWFSRIPAKNVICILDCCFSGGMGAKALHLDSLPRSMASTASLLDHLSGQGRLILTASLAAEKAWENQQRGHGLLTFHLLKGLRGAEEVVQGGKIAVYRLLEYVTQRVISDSATLGKVQHPTTRGTLNGELTWPIFEPKSLYKAAFPEFDRHRANADLQSLHSYGFPGELLSTWATFIPTLNPLQIDAINEFGVLDGDHLLVSAPTSSGKTMIGELAAIRGALNRKRAFFLFPLKALVNDKLRHFDRVYGRFGLRTIRATGDSTSDDIAPLMNGQYDVCLMTYEKCAALLLSNPYLLDQVGTVVIDEVQMIADESRGVNLEFLLTLLILRRREGSEPQIIALSAVIGDTNGLERWLGARLLRRTERPVPLDEGILRASGAFRFLSSETVAEKMIANYILPEYRKESSQDLIIPLIRRLVAEQKSVIVFRETKGEARGTARYLSESLALPPAVEALKSLPNSDPSLSSRELRQCLQGGVAFHIADLDADEREIVEEQFRAAQTLKVIAATTTLAMGVNTPAEAVVIAGLEHPGNKPYSIAEYKNIVGRAGRLGLATRGTSFLIALDSMAEHYLWSRYVLGKPEDVGSQLLNTDTDPRTLILRVLATAEHTGKGMSADDIIGFLESSFGSFLKKRQIPSWSWNRASLSNSLTELHSHNLVETDGQNLFRLTPLGRLSGISGIEVESIIRLVGSFARTNPMVISDPALLVASQVTVELDQVLFPMNKKSTQKEPQAWFGELRNQNVPQSILNSLQQRVREQHQPTLRAKKAVACLLWIFGTPISEIEDVLTRFGGRFDGAAGPIRSVRARTADLLPAVAMVAQLLHPGLDLSARLSRLLVRLEMGIPAEAVNLAMLTGDRLSRGDYLSLARAGLSELTKIATTEDAALLRHLAGSSTKLRAIRKAVSTSQTVQNNVAEPIVPAFKS
jgi:helicase